MGVIMSTSLISFHKDRLTEDTFFDIARGCYRDAIHFNKFGYIGSVGTSDETVWDGGGLYSYPTTATVASVSGTEPAGTTVNVQGLDQDFNLIDENIEVGSSGSLTFIRVFRVRLVTHTGGLNTNDIDITVDGAVRAKILAGKGQSLMAVLTVPKGYTGYLCQLQGSMEKQKEVLFTLLSKHETFNGVCNVKGKFGSFGVPVTYDYKIPLAFEEKTDIEVRAKAGATTGIGVVFDMVLLKN